MGDDDIKYMYMNFSLFESERNSVLCSFLWVSKLVLRIAK